MQSLVEAPFKWRIRVNVHSCRAGQYTCQKGALFAGLPCCVSGQIKLDLIRGEMVGGGGGGRE